MKAKQRRFGFNPIWWLVPLFGVVFAVNGVMVYFAQSTFSGLTTEHAYEKGLAYNQTLRRQAEQAQMGWRFATSLQGKTLTITAAGPGGRPLENLLLQARLTRPTAAGHDVEITLAAAAPGVYRAELALPLAGVWDAAFLASRDGQVFTFVSRLVVP